METKAAIMDSEYDRKFDDMKKYIPFLESMINRLESTSTSPTNPRQAQLDKIRSLRDLLLDKKKRMKMENLLKCEQVLVNLYAKVEQRDTLPGIKKPSDPQFQSSAVNEKPSLDVCRSKLKIVSSKINSQLKEETLPEIARAGETEIDCIPGSKEPALFHRRPNKSSNSPSRKSKSIESSNNISPTKNVPKRNYTRVLISPETSPIRWSPNTENPPLDKPLFSRRSPRKSPRRSSPHKKDKKKSSKQKKTQCRDLNITLNVPEESLSTLNKRDILSRIIECPNDDVDIKTLCDVKSQILRELKQSGSSEDISDLILKSYKVKKGNKKKDDIEEGELSDSESEAIESIYGSLVTDKDKNPSKQTNEIGKDEKSQRKVQICLVLNSDKSKATINSKVSDRLNETNTTDFVMFSESAQTEKRQTFENSKIKNQKESTIKNPTSSTPQLQEVIKIDDDDDVNIPCDQNTKDTEDNCVDISSSDNDVVSDSFHNKSQSAADSLFRANFYKPLNEPIVPQGNNLILKTNDNPDLKCLGETKEKDLENKKSIFSDSGKARSSNLELLTTSDVDTFQHKPSDTMEPIHKTQEEIPLLNTEPVVPVPPSEKDVLSEIDILQALKNEILSESIAIPGTDVATPALHQPKITKVASAQEIMAKKRISIEKYKEKACPTKQKSSLFLNDPSKRKSNDNSKKQSLKLTDEELERFKFPPKLALEDSSDEEIEKYPLNDIYGDHDEDLAPKSPDNNDQVSSESITPIIIPEDPIKPTTVSSNADIDMRKLMPILSPNTSKHTTTLQMLNNEAVGSGSENKQEPKRSSLVDPRVKRDLIKPVSKESPNSNIPIDGTPRTHLINMTPIMTPNSRSFEMTPSRQNFEATPSRQNFEMTPSRQNCDFDDTRRKHVYAPLPTFEPHREQSVQRDDREPRWERALQREDREPFWEQSAQRDDREPRWEPNCENDTWKDTDIRDRGSLNKWDDHHRGSKGWSRNDPREDYSFRKLDCPRTPLPSFGRSDTSYSRPDCPTTPVHPFGRNDGPTTPNHPFSRSDYAPSTPSHHFGRTDCPMTPNHPFGRSDIPMTPTHQTGWSEMPMTPSHPFGRADASITPASSQFNRLDRPTTPVHPFGRSDCPTTPSHPFGRSDCPTTPNHPFGRSDCPTTPNHPFGRSECPTTPSHPFGRSDLSMTNNNPFGRNEAPRTPNHPFGQSDYPQNSSRKDPRLSRNMDYGEGRDRGYQKDRRRSEYPNRNYNNSESYRNYDRDYNGGRYDTEKYERRPRDHREQTPSRESVGRGICGNYETNSLYSRDRGKGRSNDYQRDYYNAQEPTRDYRRATSVGRSGPMEERFQRASSRVSNRNFSDVDNSKTLSVRAQSGRSFTIDTSVNTTFQEFLSGKGLQALEQSTDRRSRAASVGRSLAREPSVDRSQYRESSVGRIVQNQNRVAEDTFGYKRMVNFVRARSMGRDLADDRSLKDIKADFRSYKTNSLPAKHTVSPKLSTKVPSDPRNKKDMQVDKKNNSFTNTKQTYSPRKNYRDPRMRRDHHDGNDKNKHGNKEKGFGIVYSSDNIAKGTILGPGYGVKNYKIPKIKRPVEEKKVIEPVKIDTKNAPAKSSDNVANRKTDGKKKENSQKSALVKKPKDPEPKKIEKQKKKVLNTDSKSKTSSDDKKSTRYRKGNVEMAKDIDEEVIIKTRRLKKAIIDSDSDSDTDSLNKISTTKEKDDDKMNNISLNNSFGMDDLEIFPDNIASDPVIANITALIADLDNDIDTSKAEAIDFAENNILSINTMLNTLGPPSVDKHLAESLDDISELISEDLKASENSDVVIAKQLKSPVLELKSTKEETETRNQFEKIETERKPKDMTHKSSSTIEATNAPKISDMRVEEDRTELKERGPELVDADLMVNQNTSNDAIVSTTEKETVKAHDEIGDDRCSTPDSTINNEIFLNKSFDEQGLPDSTIEKTEMHSDVTSTHDLPEVSVSKGSDSSNRTEIAPLESIGSLLSILKDKSKMQELLGMLGDHSTENEKIKKALEKISEIVSDDDNTHSESKAEIVSAPYVSLETHDVVKKSGDDNTHSESKAEIVSAPHVSLETNNVVKISEDDNTHSESKAEIVSAPHVSLETNDVVKISDNAQISIASDKIDDNIQLTEACENPSDSKESKKEIHIEEPKAKVKTKKTSIKLKKKIPVKKNTKRKGKIQTNTVSDEEKRVTRSVATNLRTEKPKKASRELKQLHESIKEMFISDDILNATGIRMCRLAKMVNDKNTCQDEGNLSATEQKPVVVLEKFQEKDVPQDVPKLRKKPGPKPKPKLTDSFDVKHAKASDIKRNKPGPKSKTKVSQDDPYSFDESASESVYTNSIQDSSATDSEDSSLVSSKSYESSEVLSEIKKKTKRKRRYGWKSGFIKKRKKTETKPIDSVVEDDKHEEYTDNKEPIIPDMNCFTDKTYCFKKNLSSYSCRLCIHTSNEIVKHYKTEHPHTEIPLSRMTEAVAREAIAQCEDINFEAISKMITEKYICRFCSLEFAGKKNTAEEFFWHVVSTHTGEYKHLCSECVNVTKCPFNLDIPPPPKEAKAQLIGYVCGKCNFTQISLENLKTHVIVRHNDEQTAVYTVNLSSTSKKALRSVTKVRDVLEKTEGRILRSSRPVADSSECSDRSDANEKFDDSISEVDSMKNTSDEVLEPKLPVHSKLTFESDDNTIIASSADSSTIKTEKEDQREDQRLDDGDVRASDNFPNKLSHNKSLDIMDCPHFKVSFNNKGTKEYMCSINGGCHYKTALLISMKKHVQMKHKEVWDGYCFICKVIVMPQGGHTFKECLQHCLDKHIDDFPVFHETDTTETVCNAGNLSEHVQISASSTLTEKYESSKCINVRPIADLISKETATDKDVDEVMPKIQSVVSLGSASNELPQHLPSYSPEPSLEGFSDTVSPLPVIQPPPKIPEPIKYEEVQAEVMAKKHRVILDTMLHHDKLVHIYKCAGTYCSYSTDSAEAAILHASSHQRVGGENSLMCAYCDYDCQKNAIDLVMHVFKTHGCCQYVCGHCFYRAVACQLVVVHIAKVHPQSSKTVLKTSTVSPITEDSSENMLSREVAVQQYVCTDFENNCQFKTYTHQKFMAHLNTHNSAAFYLCHICMAVSQTVLELMEHMKCHGYRLYQCTWCIDGGDTESDFFAHASAKHPSKEPQAYMRLIRNNKTLPLAKLISKTTVDAALVTPTETPGDPAKIAEKSLDLEKIITWTSLATNDAMKTSKSNESSISSNVAEITAIPSEAEVTKKSQETEIPQNAQVIEASQKPQLVEVTQNSQVAEGTQKTQSKEVADAIQKSHIAEVTQISLVTEDNRKSQAAEVAQNSELRALLKSQSTSPSSSSTEPNASVTLTPVLKTETLDDSSTKTISDIICLDSDEEVPQKTKQNIIDLSGDDAPATSPLKSIMFYQCSKCFVKFKISAGFKKHLTVCLQGNKIMSCAHCSFTSDNVHGLYTHYSTKHGNQESNRNTRKGPGPTSAASKSIQSEKQNVKGVVTQKSKQLSKRKLSANSSDGITENAAKRTRYGPQDLDKLPQKPILDDLAFCSECEFNTKVRLNLVRHFQQHAEDQNMVPQTAPVNPVPHLETNEKHFDKMVNLASSSLETARQDKQEKQVVVLVPPEAASRYPKYVPDKHRHTCGAKGCSYISLDESMLKYHWETLHAGSNDFHCVHCPPYQHLDTSKPLTSTRIVTHLKMHDSCLYACSACPYYHFKKQVLEKHLSEVHKGSGKMLVVREEITNQSAMPQTSNPTMDLKPWHCGLCAFKSMLLSEVVDHCSKQHNTKMQYKCPACPFRTSTLENVTKHKIKSHPGNTEDVFYFYYREGSIPDEPDGTPRWEKQRQKLGFTGPVPEVKTETTTDMPATLTPILQTPAKINLDIVKKEVVEPETEETIEELCIKFGQICDPNGLKYKCPLCKLLTSDTKDDMQSHLYEELQYRKWGCNICWYKGFHKPGLKDHMLVEHKQTRATEPIELPVDKRVERWVARVLEHQTSQIETNKANLAKQKIQVERPKPTSSTTINQDKLPEAMETSEKELDKLREVFGEFGLPQVANFCCPKCDFQSPNEDLMKDHLESELNKIRWRCSVCNKHSTNYHEAQLHCKVCSSRKAGKNPQPMPTARDPSVRASWLAQVIISQKRAMIKPPEMVAETTKPIALENSLLVVRYEEQIPTPEEEMLNQRKRPAPPVATTFPTAADASSPDPTPAAAASSPDSDDERLVIDEHCESSETANTKVKQCPHCDYTSKYLHCLHDHQLRHYNLKPYTCGYCDLTFYKYALDAHLEHCHSHQPGRFWRTKLPSGPPSVKDLPKVARKLSKTMSQDNATATPTKTDPKSDETKMICLVCEKLVTETSKHTHFIDKPTYFGRKGDVVVKCCTCLALLPDEGLMKEHHIEMHPNVQLNYAFFKLSHGNREMLQCGYCNKHFKFRRDLKTHHNVYHCTLPLRYDSVRIPGSYDYENNEKGESSIKDEDVTVIAPAIKRVARKSTTKLPSQAVARKSTTKLPFYSNHDTETEYSFYGTKPTPIDDLQTMTTMMSLGHALVPVTVKQLSNVMNIKPKVIVEDCKK